MDLSYQMLVEENNWGHETFLIAFEQKACITAQ